MNWVSQISLKASDPWLWRIKFIDNLYSISLHALRHWITPYYESVANLRFHQCIACKCLQWLLILQNLTCRHRPTIFLAILSVCCFHFSRASAVTTGKAVLKCVSVCWLFPMFIYFLSTACATKKKLITTAFSALHFRLFFSNHFYHG